MIPTYYYNNYYYYYQSTFPNIFSDCVATSSSSAPMGGFLTGLEIFTSVGWGTLIGVGRTGEGGRRGRRRREERGRSELEGVMVMIMFRV